MWHTYPPQYRTEPKELRLLKEQLAQVKCKCNVCQRTCDYLCGPPSDSFENIKYTKDIETQSEGFISADWKTLYSESTIKDALCPTCCMTLNLLRGGVVRVLKDEESETLASMFSSDKSTNKETMPHPRTSAVKSTPISPLSEKCSLFSYEPSLTDTCRVILPVRNTVSNSNSQKIRKRGSEKVSFRDVPIKPSAEPKCVCLQDFIDSIRPPLNLPSRY